MLLHLAGPAAAAHTKVFDGAAETGGLVALEMAEADDNVSIHDSVTDLCVFHQFSVVNRHLYIISSP